MIATSYTSEYFEKCADWIRERAPFTPEIGIVLGSGLGPLAQSIEAPVEIPYREIPGFLVSTVASHAGKLIFGTVGGKKVVCMSGRFHSYEGYEFEELVIPVRVLKLLGIRALILTNAAGAVNTSYKPGDIMIITDHIKLNGPSPLRGRNVPEFGDRFFDISDMYTKELRDLAISCKGESKLTIHEGVYFFMPGPQFETPAEVRAIRMLGGDAVGMSTVTEALTAAHCSLPVLGLSVMSNMAAGILKQPLTTEEVDEVTGMISVHFSAYVTEIISKM